MSDKSDAKRIRRVISKLMLELNAENQGETIILSNIIGCIRLLNNIIPEKAWRFKQPKGLQVALDPNDNAGGNA